MISARDRLVRVRVSINNQIRGLLKTFGVVLSPGRNEVFRREVLAADPSVEAVKSVILMLLDTWRHQFADQGMQQAAGETSSARSRV
jgi:transposase